MRQTSFSIKSARCLARRCPLVDSLVSIGEGKHSFPFRTRRLSPQPPMVVGPRCPARVGYCQVYGPVVPKGATGPFFLTSVCQYIISGFTMFYRKVIFLFLPIAMSTVFAGEQDPYKERREAMVREQIEGRGIADPLTLEAMKRVERHHFVPENAVALAYADRPLPIGFGQTISQPFIVAYMTEIVRPQKDHRVLEIGAGSGYQAAVLGEIVDQVYTVEIIEELATRSGNLLKELGYDNVHVRHADGYYGWPEEGPFDSIVVTAATEHIPPPLIEQLKKGGRMIVPVGSPLRTQQLMLVTKDEEGNVSTRALMPVRFVPFTREES